MSTTLTNYHLVYSSEAQAWGMFKPGDSHYTQLYSGKTKLQAVQAAAAYLQDSGSSLRIHNQNGQFEEERTYPRSADPRRSPG